MKSLGINALYLGPVFDSGCHGYDTHDFNKIDPRLGTNEDFRNFAKALKDADIHLILDGVFNHVGRGFFAVEDIKKNREASPYCDWISGLRFDRDNKYGDGFGYDNWGGHDLLPKLNLKNPKVREYLLDAVDMWIDEFGISGLRLDAADCIDHDFFRELRRRTTQKRADFWLMGEITDADDYSVWINDNMLHSVTNYQCYRWLFNSLNHKNMHEFADGVEKQFGKDGFYKDICLYNFTDNHDVNRIASVLRAKRSLKNIYTMLYTMPGVPSVYYCSEWGAKGRKLPRNDFPLRPEVDVDNPDITNPELFEHLKKLAKIRLGSKALMHGDYSTVHCTNDRLIFARCFEDETSLVFINATANSTEMTATYKGRQVTANVPAFDSTIVIY